MLFTVPRAKLLDALTHIQGIAEKSNAIPIIQNVLIEAEPAGVLLTANNLDIAVVESMSAEVKRAGSITAPAATLYDIVRRLPDSAEVTLEHKAGEQNLTLKAGKYRTNLLTLPVEDFPAMTTGTLPHNFEVPALVLRGMIDRVRFAISTEETRYYLNGIYLHAVPVDGVAMLRGVATDGHRLAMVTEALPEGAADMPGVIVPRRAVAELRKLIDKTTGPVMVRLSETRIRFELGDVAFVSKLIDGTFPEYDRVIPQGNDKVLRVGKKEFADAVGRVSAIGMERARPVKVIASADAVTIAAADPERGSASEQIEAEYAAHDMEIGFQARYLADVTDQIGGAIEFRLLDSTAPAVLVDPDDTSALYVLMPMRV